MQGKGLTQEEIEEAQKRIANPAASAATGGGGGAGGGGGVTSKPKGAAPTEDQIQGAIRMLEGKLQPEAERTAIKKTINVLLHQLKRVQKSAAAKAAKAKKAAEEAEEEEEEEEEEKEAEDGDDEDEGDDDDEDAAAKTTAPRKKPWEKAKL